MWLDGVERTLAAATAPVDVFFRDDDAGWADDRLFEMLDVFADHATPVDLAVIPFALGPDLAACLRRRRDDPTGLVGLHQHGVHHVNHEPTGRKCEFGTSRPREAQMRDLAAGRARLEDLLGGIDPIFTPPWNRCTRTTADCLPGLGFEALSQDLTAPPLGSVCLVRLPVAVDWCKWRADVAGSWLPLGGRIAEALAADAGPLGIMLHHAVMDERDRAHLGALLSTFASAGTVRCHRMVALVRELSPAPHP